MNLRILFKTKNFDTVEEMTHYAPVPAGLDYRQAIQMLRRRRAGARQTRAAGRRATKQSGPTRKGEAALLREAGVTYILAKIDDQGEQGEGLDEGQAENQEGA